MLNNNDDSFSKNEIFTFKGDFLLAEASTVQGVPTNRTTKNIRKERSQLAPHFWKLEIYVLESLWENEHEKPSEQGRNTWL